VVTSDDHSTVWDGETTLFDLNFLALGVSPAECYRKARRKGVVLKPGEHMPIGFADHYSVDVRTT
jgi:alanine-alpha-ketoisovalerate/valine-pyruvate aminotransferase